MTGQLNSDMHIIDSQASQVVLGKEFALPMQELQRRGFEPWVGKIFRGGNGNPPNIFAWKSQRTEEPVDIKFIGLQRVGLGLHTYTHTHTHIKLIYNILLVLGIHSPVIHLCYKLFVYFFCKEIYSTLDSLNKKYSTKAVDNKNNIFQL